MKIAHIITKLELGGAQQNTLFTCRNLPGEKFETFLISGPGGILDEEALDLNPCFVEELVREVSPVKDFTALMKMISILRELRPDIVHTHSSKAGILGRWAAWFAGVPVILHTFHGFGFNPEQNPLVRNFFIFLEKITALITDAFVFVSGNNREQAGRLRLGDPAKYHLIHSGIVLHPWETGFRPDAEREKMGIEREERVVGTVSCFKPQKAPLDFVEIAAKVKLEIPKVKFIFIGDGELRPLIEKRIEELGMKDDFFLLGWRRDVHKIVPLFDVFLLTSLWEGLPRAILEAFWSEVPAVASRVDGNAEIVTEGEDGYLVPVHNIDQFAEKVLMILGNPDIRRKMGKQGRKKIRGDFDIKIMAERLARLYTKLCSSKNT